MTRPGVTILPFGGKTPRIHETAFVAPGCHLIGDVEIGPDASIWYNCVLRGDVNRIVVGARSNIQDGSVIHCDSPDEHPGEGGGGAPTIIGEDVLIGHMVMAHGCVLADRSFVGIGAIVLSGARIEEEGMLGAGAMLTGGKVIERRQLWTGRPAKYWRDIDDAAFADMQAGVKRYVANGRAHGEALDAAER